MIQYLFLNAYLCAMRYIIIAFALFVSSVQAQNVSPLDIAARIGLKDIWLQDQLIELSTSDRINKLAIKDDIIEADYAMDLAGYMLCVDLFERTARAADFLYGGAKIYLREDSIPLDMSKALDPVYMEKAYREGEARLDITRKYRVGNQEMSLTFVSNDKVRRFIMMVKSPS